MNVFYNLMLFPYHFITHYMLFGFSDMNTVQLSFIADCHSGLACFIELKSKSYYLATVIIEPHQIQGYTMKANWLY